MPEGIAARVRWTQRHLDKLTRACRAVTSNEDFYSIKRHELDEGLSHEYRVQEHRGVPTNISLIIGDVVHNMRSP